MTNAEKYKTAEERERAFERFCGGRDCSTCPLNDFGGLYAHTSCRFPWLDLDEGLSAMDVVRILAGRNPYTNKTFSAAFDRAMELLRNMEE